VGQVLDQRFVLVLTIRTKGTAEEEDVGKEETAIRFLVQGSLVLWGEGSFAGEEEGAVVVGEVVVEFGTEPKVEDRG